MLTLLVLPLDRYFDLGPPVPVCLLIQTHVTLIIQSFVRSFVRAFDPVYAGTRAIPDLDRSNADHRRPVFRILTVEQQCKGNGLIMPSPKAFSARSFITLADAAAAQNR